MLGGYFPDLTDERFETIGCFGHNRYSTNTWPSFTRVQPFGVLGHNGEINTIEQLRQEARMLGIPVGEGNSDSQDLNRVIETLCRREGLSLAEAMEMVVPPIVAEIVALPEELHSFYMYVRQLMGPVRAGSGGADRPPRRRVRVLGGRARPAPPVAAREPRRLRVQLRARRRLGPGHGLRAEADGARREVHGHDRPRQAALVAAPPRGDAARGEAALAGPRRRRGDALLQGRAARRAGRSRAARSPATPPPGRPTRSRSPSAILAGFGWQRDDVKLVQQMASNGAEPIGSLGYDGPLAALSPERQNLADYFKETVAVVTNPAIDREREIEHFSTRAIFGHRPAIETPGTHSGIVATDIPVLLGGHHDMAPLGDGVYRRIAADHGTYLLEDLWEEFRDRVASGHEGRAKAIDIALLESETTEGAIGRLQPGGRQGRQRRHRAAGPDRPHRL